jgi:glutamyl-tRNA reductase
VRESLAFDGPKHGRALALLRDRFPGAEFAILSTCNRVELYAAAASPVTLPEVPDLTDWLAGFHTLPPASLAAHLVAHHDEAVVSHVFRVASSLESLVLGEGQILAQVREAYRDADACGSIGPILHAMFREAIRVGKLVRERTGLDRGRLSVASVAVDLAREVFDSFGDKTVLVIGAGKMAELTLTHLAELRPGRILITNRSPDRAEEAASRWRGQAVPFERLSQALVDADLVVSTTASEEPVVDLPTYERVQRARRNRLALILDIAVPRDFDERIGRLEQVLLYNVDDLQLQVRSNLEGRRRGIEPAQALIEQETTACLAALRQRHGGQGAGALLRELGLYTDTVRDRELVRLFDLCPDLTEPQRAAITQFARRLQNQYLHHPRTALRQLSGLDPAADEALASAPQDDGHLMEVVRHLFGLGHENGR